MFDGCDVTERPGSGPTVPWGGQMLGGGNIQPLDYKIYEKYKYIGAGRVPI